VLEIEDCLRQAMAIRGALGASLIDYTSGLTLGSVGSGPCGDHEVTAAGASQVVHAIVDSAAFATLGVPGEVDDVTIKAGNGYHLVHFLPTKFDARLVFYLWLDKTLGNLAMTQRSLRSIAGDLVAG
jgi:hypothetical protein